jgi:hypothetical protein
MDMCRMERKWPENAFGLSGDQPRESIGRRNGGGIAGF